MHISQLLNIRSSSSLVFAAIFSIVIAVVLVNSPVNGVPIDSTANSNNDVSSQDIARSSNEDLSIVLPRKSNFSSNAISSKNKMITRKVTRRRRLSALNDTSNFTTDKPKREAISSAENLTSPLTNISSASASPSAQGLDNQASSSLYSLNSSPDPLSASVNNFFDTLRHSYQTLLITAQRGLLKAIGLVDQTVASVQDGVENSSFTLVLEGQKVSAKLYDLTPPVVNRWIQRVGTSRDNRIFQQANGVLTQFTDSKKKWYEAWFEHEHDWHNHFQDNVFPTVNNNLRVPSLPKMKFGW